MSIPEMQACLARLYVDHSFLRLFLLEPGAALGEYVLSAEEREAVVGIDSDRLERFAQSLVMKRKKRFELAYPLLFGIDFALMGRYYERFYRLRRISPHDVHLHVALEFGRFLEESLAGDSSVPSYASEVARYERVLYAVRFVPEGQAGPSSDADPAGNRASEPEPRPAHVPIRHPGARVETFSFDVQAIQKALKAGEPAPEAANATHRILFVPGDQPGRARTFEITDGSLRLLELCDGSATLEAIVRELEDHYGRSDLERSILASARSLASAGALRLADTGS